MNRTINIIRYDGLHKRTADELLALGFVSNGAFAETPPTSARELRKLRCLEDAAAVLSDDSSNSGDIAGSPLVQSFINNGWLGEAIVASVQIVSTIYNAILNNVKTWVFFRCPNPREAQFGARILGGDRGGEAELAEIIQHLPKRHFVAWSEGFEGPIIGKTPEIDTGPKPTEQEIDDHMRPILEEISKDLVMSPPFEDDSSAPICYLEDDGAESNVPGDIDESPLSADPQILADYVKFINVIAANENLSTRELNTTLGMSAGKVAKIRATLAMHGYVAIRKESGTTGRPKLIVEITPTGLHLLETWRKSK